MKILRYALVVSFILVFILSSSRGENVGNPLYKNPNLPIEERVEDLLSKMTLDEKIAQLSGKTHMETRENSRLGIPALKMADGPHGIRRGKATCFPTGVSLASTWNPELINEVGVALAEEARAKGVNLLLGPCINIHRTPCGGRNFESFSEDPYLTSQIASAYVRGVQSQHVGTAVKHFVCNNQEWGRFNISVEIDERTLREIYLPGFKAAVKEGGAYAVMAAYNKVNGDYCSANRHLLKDILKDEWKFEGLVVSDWGATHSTVKSANAGLDLEMPGPGRFFNKSLKQALKGGQVREEVIDDKVRRILRVKFKLGLFDNINSKYKGALNTQEHKELAYRVASESIVLLKNEKNLLPLDKDKIKSIALIGPNANEARLGGGGSSIVSPFYSVSPLEGLKNKCNDKIRVNYTPGCLMPEDLSIIPEEVLFVSQPSENIHGLKGEYFNNINLSGEPVLTRVDKRIDFNWRSGSPAPQVKNECFSVRWTGKMKVKESGIYQIGTISDDGSRVYLDGEILVNNWRDHGPETRKQSVYLEKGKVYDLRIEFYERRGGAVMKFGWISPANNLLKDAIEVAKNSDVAVVCVGLSSLIEGEGLDKRDIKLPFGQDELINEITKVNKNTIVVLINGTPIDMRKWIDKVPVVIEAWYPGQEGGNAIADILFGDVNPSGKLPVTFPKKIQDSASFRNYPGKKGKVFYAEGIFVGYRHFDKNNIEPLFCFGHGLSYTTFRYSNLKINTQEDLSSAPVKVSFDIENIGEVAGKEVCQLYIHDVESSLPRPLKELKAFKKVELKPGERKTVEFGIDRDSLHYYDPEKKRWVIEPGEFEVLIGSSSRDIRLRESFWVR